MKVKTKFAILLTVMGLFGFLAASVGIYGMRIHVRVDNAIEVANTEKYLLEKILRSYLFLKEGYDGTIEKELRTSQRMFEINLKALKNGGIVLVPKEATKSNPFQSFYIKPLGKEKEYKPLLTEIENGWKKIKNLLASNAQPYEVYLETKTVKEDLNRLIDKLKLSDDRYLFYELEIGFIIAGTFVFIIIGIMLFDVSKRIEKLSYAISSIPTGKFCKLSKLPEKYRTDDEIGRAFIAAEETSQLIFSLLGRIKTMLQNFQAGKISKVRTEDLEGKWKEIGELLNAISEKWAEGAQTTLRWIECFKKLKSCETCERRFNCIIPADNKGIYKEIYGTLKKLKDETMVAANEIDRFRKEVSKAIREGKMYIPSSIDYSKIPDFLHEIAKSLEDMAISLLNALSSQKIFLATVSHDIRTPLNGIIGFLGLLNQSDKLSPKDREYVELALSSAKQLLSLVNDILDVAKIQAEQIELYTEPINIIKVVKDTAFALSSNLKEGVELKFNFPEKEIWVEGDEKRIKQIFFNLLSNAAKFTEKGFIEVGLKRVKEEKDKNAYKLLFYVKDTGIGIPYEKQPLLFKPFSQIKSRTAKKAEGTGLGLFITKKLANIMGGDVWVDSKPGEGSTFFVLLELKKAKAPAKQEQLDEIECENVDRNLKVLVAEDIIVNQIFIKELLKKKFGIENIKIVDNGKKAVETVEKEPFDLVLMDLKMPVMDGLTAVKKIREKGIDIPIFMLTADAFRDSEEKAIKAGADGYLVKPVDFKQLCKALSYASKIKRNKKGEEK